MHADTALRADYDLKEAPMQAPQTETPRQPPAHLVRLGSIDESMTTAKGDSHVHEHQGVQWLRGE